MTDAPLAVLLVEDNAAAARLLSEDLAESTAPGFQVTHADCLAAAVGRLKESRFDLVLLDLTLPDSDSLDTVRRVRREAPHTPIVVLTGMESEALGVEAVREGAQDYLPKGQTDRRLLVRAIRYALERHRVEEELARYRDRLEELVARRTAALASTNRVLQEQMLERQRAEEELAAARRKLATDQEQQRRHLAGELHDAVGQELIGLKMSLERTLAQGQKVLGQECHSTLCTAVQKCMELIREVRTISHGLYPPALQMFGLVASLRQLASGCPSPPVVAVSVGAAVENTRFDGEVEIALFRIAQEAIQNALRHGRAAHVHIHVNYADGAATLAVVDDGVGFDALRSWGEGLGLMSMRDRALTAGGTLRITSKPGETRVEVCVPAAIRKDEDSPAT